MAGDQHIHQAPIKPSAAVAPAPPPDFVGRAEQLVQLAALLRAGKSAAITALPGMGGIGKTALAQQLAVRLGEEFPGGVFWADLAWHQGSAESILVEWGRICEPALRQLAQVLPRVLVGVHDPDLSRLPDEMAQAVRAMVGRL